jgi:uncharacterized protein YbbK (DUF523 family)
MTPQTTCPRCNHPSKLHDKRRGCRISFTERDPERGRVVVVCGCKAVAAGAPSPRQVAEMVRGQAAAAGVTVEEFARRLNEATVDDIRAAMEASATDTLEWAVKFESLAHRGGAA